MRTHTLLITLMSVALSASGAVYAKGPGGVGGGQGYGHMSGQGAANQNAQTMEDATRGQERAEERRTQQEGSGAQYEKRTLTKEQNEIKTKNEAQVREKTQTQVKPKGPSDEPQKLQEQTKEQSREQLRIQQ